MITGEIQEISELHGNLSIVSYIETIKGKPVLVSKPSQEQERKGQIKQDQSSKKVAIKKALRNIKFTKNRTEFCEAVSKFQQLLFKQKGSENILILKELINQNDYQVNSDWEAFREYLRGYGHMHKELSFFYTISSKIKQTEGSWQSFQKIMAPSSIQQNIQNEQILAQNQEADSASASASASAPPQPPSPSPPSYSQAICQKIKQCFTENREKGKKCIQEAIEKGKQLFRDYFINCVMFILKIVILILQLVLNLWSQDPSQTLIFGLFGVGVVLAFLQPVAFVLHKCRNKQLKRRESLEQANEQSATNFSGQQQAAAPQR